MHCGRDHGCESKGLGRVVAVIGIGGVLGHPLDGAWYKQFGFGVGHVELICS